MSDCMKRVISIVVCVILAMALMIAPAFASTSGVGYQNDTYLASGTAELKEQAGYVTTDFIPYVEGDVLRFRGVTWGESSYNRVACYNANKELISVASSPTGANVVDEGSGIYRLNPTFVNSEGMAYLRVTFYGKGENLVYGVNESISFDMDDLTESADTIFSSALSWLGAVADVIFSHPLLLFPCLLPVVGLGIGFFRRLM